MGRTAIDDGAGDGDILAHQTGGDAVTRGAQQGRHRRLPAGEIGGSIHRHVGALAVHRQAGRSLRTAAQSDVADGRQRSQVGHHRMYRGCDVAAGLGGAVRVDERVAQGKAQRQMRAVQRGVYRKIQRCGGEQVGLRPGQAQAGQHRVGVHRAAVAGDIGRQGSEGGATAAHIRQHGMSGHIRRGERTVHMRLQGDPAPGDVGPRRHRRRAGGHVQGGGMAHQVDGAVRLGPQGTGGGHEVGAFCAARAGDGAVHGQGAQRRQLGHAGDQAAGRLAQVERGPYRLGVDAAVQRVGALPIQPVDGDLGAGVVKRLELAGPVDPHGGGSPGHRRAEVQSGHLQHGNIDPHRQAEAAAGGLRRLGRGGCHRQARHADMRDGQPADLGDTADQRQRRPVQHHPIQRHPGTARVVHLRMGQPQRIGKPAGQAAQHHRAASEARDLAFDESAPWPDVGHNQHQRDQGHGQQQDHPQTPQQDAPEAVAGLGCGVAQNACPRPR